MARITIEDCLDKIPNRFELTLAATNRARQISAGSAPLVEQDRWGERDPRSVAGSVLGRKE